MLKSKKAKQHTDLVQNRFGLLLSDYKYIHKRDVSSYFRDTISSSKEVTNSVHLDPWHAGNCSVCFG
jgi:hypothetical protein